MENARLNYLFHRYYERTISEEEREELMKLFGEEANQDEIKHLIDEKFRFGEAEYRLNDEVADDILASIFKVGDQPTSDIATSELMDDSSRSILPIWTRTLVAACIALLVIYAGFSWYQSTQQVAPKQALHSKYGEDVLPGSEKAFLQLDNGKIVDLATTSAAQLTSLTGVEIHKSEGGIVLKDPTAEKLPAEASYHVLTTPLGGQYKIVLPDGSKAWLNAGSRLRFPTFFADNGREVEMYGEVYFEVEPDKKRPFKVKIEQVAKRRQTEIQVLGTHFNVSSYKDEPVIQTTLLEGSVEVRADKQQKILTPGEQANVADREIDIKKVDAENVIAWKEDRFEFSGNIKGIMRQIARWYDLDVVYEPGVETMSFAGAISRKNNVSEVLKMLEYTGGVKFTIKGKKIIVKSSE